MNLQVQELDRAHREELIREAEQHRLTHPTPHPQAQHTNPTLVALGRQMVRLGERLQGHNAA